MPNILNVWDESTQQYVGIPAIVGANGKDALTINTTVSVLAVPAVGDSIGSDASQFNRTPEVGDVFLLLYDGGETVAGRSWICTCHVSGITSQTVFSEVDGVVETTGSAAEVTADNVNTAYAGTTALQKQTARENIGVASKLEVASALHKTARGAAIRIDDVSPLAHNLSITQYGQCVQDGTPTPEAPIPITVKAAGASVYKKNLFDESTWTIRETVDGRVCLKFSGYLSPITGEHAGNLLFINGNTFPEGTSQITISGKFKKTTYFNRLKARLTDGTDIGVVDFDDNFVLSSKTLAIPEGKKILKVYLDTGSRSAYGYVEELSFQLELGDTATAYEPYAAPITQTVADANGDPVALYGVPVASGSNVTIDGQQYVADTFDGTTVTRRCGHIASYNGETITTAYISSTGELSTGADVYYVLDEPTTETVTVSPDTLVANFPTTTVVSDAYTEVSYNGDSTAVYNELKAENAELRAAIIALGGSI